MLLKSVVRGQCLSFFQSCLPLGGFCSRYRTTVRPKSNETESIGRVVLVNHFVNVSLYAYLYIYTFNTCMLQTNVIKYIDINYLFGDGF